MGPGTGGGCRGRPASPWQVPHHLSSGLPHRAAQLGERKCSPNTDKIKLRWKHPARDSFPRRKTRHAQGWAQSRHWWMPAEGTAKPQRQSLLCVAAGWLCPHYRRSGFFLKTRKWFHGYQSLLSFYQGTNGEFSEPRKFCKGSPSPTKPTAYQLLDQLSSEPGSPIHSSRVAGGRGGGGVRGGPVRDANLQDPPRPNESETLKAGGAQKSVLTSSAVDSDASYFENHGSRGTPRPRPNKTPPVQSRLLPPNLPK